VRAAATALTLSLPLVLAAGCPRQEHRASAPDAGARRPRPPGPEIIAAADEATVTRTCGACHAVPAPDMMARSDWDRAVEHMRAVIKKRRGVPPSDDELLAIRAYYMAKSPEKLEILPPDPQTSPVRFERQNLGQEPLVSDDDRENGPSVINVGIADLDRDGRPDVMVCTDITRTVSWIHRDGKGAFSEATLAMTPTPGRTFVYDHDRDGDLDVLVAVLGSLMPSEQPVGAVLLLVNDGKGHFVAQPLATGLPRTVDARPADFDGDGDHDVVIAAFGFIASGEIAWLEQRGPHEWVRHVVLAAPGAIHVPVADLDGDGDMDFAAIVAQDSEAVMAYLNDGKGTFTPRTIFAAGMPTFGAAGLEMVDLDRDGDQDFLVVNGDILDGPVGPRPYHGVRLLENKGGLRFEARQIGRLHGAYAAAAGDLDGDGDLDVAAVAMFNLWEDRTRQSVIWLENDGKLGFTSHAVGNDPIHQVTVAIADLDGDGRNDIVTGGIHKLAPPKERMGRVSVWWNRGPAK
jgi:hypothetical protein